MTPGRILLMIAAVLASLLFYVVGQSTGGLDVGVTWEFAYIASLTLGLGIVLVFNMRPGWSGGWQATYFIVIGAGAMIASIAGIDALS